MIDNLTLLLSHGLILLACWRLLSRPDLDDDNPKPEPGFLRPPSPRQGGDTDDA